MSIVQIKKDNLIKSLKILQKCFGTLSLGFWLTFPIFGWLHVVWHGLGFSQIRPVLGIALSFCTCCQRPWSHGKCAGSHDLQLVGYLMVSTVTGFKVEPIPTLLSGGHLFLFWFVLTGRHRRLPEHLLRTEPVTVVQHLLPILLLDHALVLLVGHVRVGAGDLLKLFQRILWRGWRGWGLTGTRTDEGILRFHWLQVDSASIVWGGDV